MSIASDGRGSASLDLADWSFGNQLATFLNGTNGPFNVTLAPQAGKYTVNIETAPPSGHPYLLIAFGLLLGGGFGWMAWGRK